MKAIETVRHGLALAVRVDDHFTMAPARSEYSVTIDSHEPPAPRSDNGGVRHADGTYRWLTPVKAGARQVTVTGDAVFTWTATTSVVLPLPDPKTPVVIEVWPAPNAVAAVGSLALRGQVVPRPAAAPVALGQEIRIEAVGISTLRNRKSRCDANGEFLFVVHGPTELTNAPAADKRAKVRLSVTAPAPLRAIDSVDVFEGGTVTTFPGSQFAVLPGRETRIRIKLS